MNKRFARIRRNKKRLEQNKKNKIRISIKNISLALIVAIISYTTIDVVREYNIDKKENGSTKIGANYEITKSIATLDNAIDAKDIETIEEKKIQNIEFEKVEDEEKGYSVCARLEIEKINLVTNILSEYSQESLEKCVTKFYGPNPNEMGNFVIVGHNYENPNMFKRLKELKLGDSINLIDNVNGNVEYIVNDIFKVDGKNVECLEQKDEQEVTLITCVNYTNDRLIIKALKK